jgi:hypothetical protein
MTALELFVLFGLPLLIGVSGVIAATRFRRRHGRKREHTSPSGWPRRDAAFQKVWERDPRFPSRPPPEARACGAPAFRQPAIARHRRAAASRTS